MADQQPVHPLSMLACVPVNIGGVFINIALLVVCMEYVNSSYTLLLRCPCMKKFKLDQKWDQPYLKNRHRRKIQVPINRTQLSRQHRPQVAEGLHMSSGLEDDKTERTLSIQSQTWSACLTWTFAAG